MNFTSLEVLVVFKRSPEKTEKKNRRSGELRHLVWTAADLHVRGNICCHINFNYSAESLKQHGTVPLVCPCTAPKGWNEQS